MTIKTYDPLSIFRKFLNEISKAKNFLKNTYRKNLKKM